MESDRSAAETIRSVAVLGTGTMGQGIVFVCTLNGFDVRAFDADPATASSLLPRIERSLDASSARGNVEREDRAPVLSRVRLVGSVEEAVESADLVIEATPEDLRLKQEVFQRADAAAPAHAILASNTSSLSITRLAEATGRADRVIGLHFFNPVHRMRLLEVVRGAGTSERTLSAALAFATRLDKEAIVVSDSPGFATSRLGVLLGLEAIRMVEQGVAAAADIDRAMELGYNHPMGPLRLTDLIGLDVRLRIAEYLWSELGADQFRPPDLLRTMVAEGRLGRKSGRGFFDWSEG